MKKKISGGVRVFIFLLVISVAGLATALYIEIADVKIDMSWLEPQDKPNKKKGR